MQDDRVWVVKKRRRLFEPQHFVTVHLTPSSLPSPEGTGSGGDSGPFIAGFFFYKHAYLMSVRMNELNKPSGDRGDAFVTDCVPLDLLKDADWTSLGVAIFDQEYHPSARPCLVIEGLEPDDARRRATRGLVWKMMKRVFTWNNERL